MRRLGLRSSLLAATAILIAAIATFIAWWFPSQQRIAAQEALDNRARAVTGILAKMLTPTVELDRPLEAASQLGPVKDLSDLRYVAVVKPDGTVFVRHPVRPGGWIERLGNVAEEQRVDEGGLHHVSVPLHSRDAVLGTLVIGLSTDAISAAYLANRNGALLIGLIVFAFGVLAAFLVADRIARPMRDVSRQLGKLSAELVAAARAQEAAGAEQAAAIEETRRTMDMMLGSAQQIADSSSAVLGNAERTVEGNRDVAQRIRELNTHAEKVAEILATIMQVADRTDLLALNAALEGTKAGEAGRGFTLVAGEMRRLAESVMESVAGIRKLMNDVRSASQSAVQAGAQGIALSEQTTRSAGEIALVTQQQRRATEQVGRSMDEMGGAVNNTMAQTRQTARSAAELTELARLLSGLIGRAEAHGQGGGEHGGERPRS